LMVSNYIVHKKSCRSVDSFLEHKGHQLENKLQLKVSFLFATVDRRIRLYHYLSLDE
jgi:hypothetical protein